MKRNPIALSIKATLPREGVRRLLSMVTDAAVIDADPAVAPDPEPSLWIVDPETLAQYFTFFSLRRKATALLSAESSDTFQVVDPMLPSDAIIERLQTILSDLPDADDGREALSPREIDVLRLLARGFINKEIADRLSISINTVLSHRKNITAKLGIKSVSGLGIYAVINGYLNETEFKI